MNDFFFNARRELLSHSLEGLLRLNAWRLARKAKQNTLLRQSSAEESDEADIETKTRPEDFRPLENSCFQDPYAFYKLLRDEHPVYQLPNGIFCISRFDDITALSRDTENYSSTHQGVIAGLRPDQCVIKAGERVEALAKLGIVPSNVLALSDPPIHTSERKVGHKGLNARFVKSLEKEVEALCKSMMDEFIDQGQVEFMQEFGWKLPMKLIIKLLGFPEQDYEKIKDWCVHLVASQSGISTPVELNISQASGIAFTRYCHRQFLIAKREQRNDLTAPFVQAVLDPENRMSDRVAASALFQLLIAGSDSSATSMGNALKMLIENPELADQIRADMDTQLPAFIEEVFRLEAAFQGHFRWTKNDTELHGVKLPRGSRIFLMWASGNRDERVFEAPDEINLKRRNGKKHLTFGHGVHACIGRELARSEIRIVLRDFLTRTQNLRFNGEHPFVASMFARTLLALPVAFEKVNEVQSPTQPSNREIHA